MKRLSNLLAFAVCLALAPLPHVHGQSPEEGLENHTIPPDLAQLMQDYAPKEKALDEELKTQLEPATKAYQDALATLIQKIEHSSTPEKGDPIRKEVGRFASSGLAGAPDENVPVGVKSAWKTYVTEAQKITLAFAPKRTALRAQHLKDLAEIEKGWVAKNDTIAIAAVRRARTFTILRTAAEENRVQCTETNPKPVQVTDIPHEGGYLIGFAANAGKWWNSQVTEVAEPIFMTPEGVKTGRAFGRNHGNTKAIAKDGYAVGAITVRGKIPQPNVEVVGCFQLTFMKINPDGLTLDPKDSYQSDWLGDPGGLKPKEHSGRGKLILGVRAKSGDDTDTLSLLFMK
ncbi:MAG: serine protease [Akkermansiaceae bacterium]|nr:serine protease [Akkermansiaceae bacterium]